MDGCRFLVTAVFDAPLADLRKLGFEVLNANPHGRIERLARSVYVFGRKLL